MQIASAQCVAATEFPLWLLLKAALEEAIDIYQAAFGLDHARTQQVVRLTSDFYRQRGLTGKAEQLEELLAPQTPSPSGDE
jgi:hypothetical protein